MPTAINSKKRITDKTRKKRLFVRIENILTPTCFDLTPRTSAITCPKATTNKNTIRNHKFILENKREIKKARKETTIKAVVKIMGN